METAGEDFSTRSARSKLQGLLPGGEEDVDGFGGGLDLFGGTFDGDGEAFFAEGGGDAAAVGDDGEAPLLKGREVLVQALEVVGIVEHQGAVIGELDVRKVLHH